MRRIALLICYCFALSVAHAQLVDLSLPTEGSVFQQDNTGRGTIKIMGTSFFLRRYFSFSAFGQTNPRTAFAQLIPLSVATGQPLPSGTPVYIPLSAGVLTLSGSGNVAAGWYELTLYEKVERQFGIFPGFPRFPPTYNRITNPIKVGVGEVYIIGGQSNAQGLLNLNDGYVNVAQPRPTSTDSDGIRVQPLDPAVANPNYFNDYVNTYNINAVKATYMTRLSSVAAVRDNQGIAPTGYSLWYWADLGKRISNSFPNPVPVAFYNAAWYGTQINAWAGSTDRQYRHLQTHVVESIMRTQLVRRIEFCGLLCGCMEPHMG